MMYFTPSPLESNAVPSAEIPFLNRCYIHTTDDRTDPSLVWGTVVDMSGLQAFLAQNNAGGRSILTTTPILIRAVGVALVQHPEFNCRVLGEKVYRFNQVNVLVPVQRRSGGPSFALINRIDQQSYAQLFRAVWAEQQGAARAKRSCDIGERLVRYLPTPLAHIAVRGLLWLSNHVQKPMGYFDRALRGAPVIVNHFGFPGAPPLHSYKPSRFGSHCTLLNVTLGPTEMRPTVVDGQVVARPMASLFVRADHRTADAWELARFVSTIVEVLSAPENFDLCEAQPDAESADSDSSHDLHAVAAHTPG